MARSRWAAAGAALAVCLGAGGVSWVGATISSGSRAVFVPITPCRLVDTRPTTPLGPASTTTYSVHGTNGACTIPTGATAISGNATITDPTDDGFMTLAPTGGIGTASNLNWLRSQSPTPNAFTVALSVDGKIDVFNDRGTVNVIIDVNGYYEDHDHDDRYYTEAEVDTALGAKANAADVYTKTQINALPSSSVIGGGGITIGGTIGNLVPRFGTTWTVAKPGTGVYTISVPGLNPGCANPLFPLVLASPIGVGHAVPTGVGVITCATGNTSFQINTYSLAGASADIAFQFMMFRPGNSQLLPSSAPPGATECIVDAEEVRCS